MSVLFVSYNGVLEPLGQSQVLPYVRGLAKRGHRMEVLSFEKEDRRSHAWGYTESLLRNEGIAWYPRRYHKTPPVLSTAVDVVVGVACILRRIRHGVRLVHARAHVPALMAELSRRLTAVPYLFDHRGLMAEELADSGIWRRGGALFRLTEKLERSFVGRAARVVVLTERLRDELRDRRPTVTVIPCAVDMGVFKPPEQGAAQPYDLVYAGSWTGLYRGRDMLAFYDALRVLRPEARFLLLVSGRSEGGSFGPGVEFRRATPSEVPALLRLARAGVSMRQPGHAQIAAAPVKVSEYLASGLPVVSSPGVGDLDRVLRATRTGVVLKGFTSDDLQEGARELVRLLEDRETSRRCRQVAVDRYDLEAAIGRYDRAYRGILTANGA